MVKKKFKRTRKLILPKLQLTLAGAFLGTTLFCLLFQYLLFASSVSSVAMNLPNDSEAFFEAYPSVLMRVLIGSFGLILPLIFLVGILVTHRIAGPIYRFGQFLSAVNRGEHPGECRIRKGDQLQDFCQLLNTTTQPLRDGQVRPVEAEESEAPAPSRAA